MEDVTQETEGAAHSDASEAVSAAAGRGSSTVQDVQGQSAPGELPPEADVGPDGVARVPGRLGQVVSDMLRTMLIIGAVVAVIVLITLRPSPDPVRAIDALPTATAVQAAVDYPILLPRVDGWRATSARWEATEASGEDEVWFAGGVLNDADQFVSVSQSPATGKKYLLEQTGGLPTDEVLDVDGTEWAVYQGEFDAAAVNQMDDITTVVRTNTGSGMLPDYIRSLEPVG